jgi:photosystem II stability/assembly factor-like uncharacterized protein
MSLEGRNGTLYAGTLNGLNASTDAGMSWKNLNGGVLDDIEIQCIVVEGATIFAGTYYYGVYVSTDGGGSWNKRNTGLPLNTSVYDLVRHNGDLFAALQYDGLFRSTDNGATWFSLNDALPNYTWPYAIIERGDDLILGGDMGVYVSQDDGVTWSKESTGLPFNNDVRSLAAISTSSGSYLFAGVNGYSVWRRPLSEITNVESTVLSPSGFELSQNYPNPFNPTTKIHYAIPAEGKVRLSVFDLLGREVAVLVDEIKPQGVFVAEFDGTMYSSGMFVYQLKCNGTILSRQMTLLR